MLHICLHLYTKSVNSRSCEHIFSDRVGSSQSQRPCGQASLALKDDFYGRKLKSVINESMRLFRVIIAGICLSALNCSDHCTTASDHVQCLERALEFSARVLFSD